MENYLKSEYFSEKMVQAKFSTHFMKHLQEGLLSTGMHEEYTISVDPSAKGY